MDLIIHFSNRFDDDRIRQALPTRYSFRFLSVASNQNLFYWLGSVKITKSYSNTNRFFDRFMMNENGKRCRIILKSARCLSPPNTSIPNCSHPE